MVMEQFFNVAQKEIVLLLREKRFKTSVGAVGDSLSEGVADSCLLGSPRYSSGVSNKSERVLLVITFHRALDGDRLEACATFVKILDTSSSIVLN